MQGEVDELSSHRQNASRQKRSIECQTAYE